MTLMTENQFTTLLKEINCAHSLSLLQQAYHHLGVFTPDAYFFELATIFNQSLKQRLGSTSSKLFFDLEHIKMLVRLRDSAEVVKQIDSVIDTSLNWDRHYNELSSMIDTFANTTNYEFYCNYFYINIFNPLSEFYPLIQYQIPNCVLHSMSKLDETNFSPYLGLQNNLPSTSMVELKHNEQVSEIKKTPRSNGSLDEKSENVTTSKKLKLSLDSSVEKPSSYMEDSESNAQIDDEWHVPESEYSTIFKTRLELVKKKSIRVYGAILYIFNREASSNSIIKEDAKEYFLNRIVELLEDLDQSGLIAHRYKGIKIKEFLNGAKEYEELMTLVLLGRKIYLTDAVQDPTRKMIYQKAGYHPVMVRSKIPSGGEQYKLLFCNPDDETLRFITFDKSQIDDFKTILFSEPTKNYDWLCVDLPNDCRDTLLLFTNVHKEEPGTQHKDVLLNHVKRLKLFRAFFAAALIYVLDKNEFTLKAFIPSIDEAFDDPVRGFKKLLKVLEREDLGITKLNLSNDGSMEYFSTAENTAGMICTDPWAFQPRYETRKFSDTSLRPSPHEMLTGNGVINNTPFAQEFFQELYSRFEFKNNMRTLIKEAIELDHAAHASKVLQWTNVLLWVIMQETKTLTSNFWDSPLNLADFCGGWGNRLVAFGTLDKATLFKKLENNGKKIQVGKIVINDVNKKLIPVYKNTIEAYFKDKAGNIELLSEPVEKFPKEKLEQLRNTFSISATSPPYGDKEKYDPHEGANQSWRYTNLKWEQEFLAPFIKNTFIMTRDGGWMVLVVANVLGGLNVRDMAKQIMAPYCQDKKVRSIGYGRSRGGKMQEQDSNNQAETFLIGKVDKLAKIEKNLSFFGALEMKNAPKEISVADASLSTLSSSSSSAAPNSVMVQASSAVKLRQARDPKLYPAIMSEVMSSFDPFCEWVGRINLLNHPKREEAVLFFPSEVMNSRRFVQIFPEKTTTESTYFRMLGEVFGREVIKQKNTPQEALDLVTHSKMKEGVLLKGILGSHCKYTLSKSSTWKKVALTIFTIGSPNFFTDSPAHQAEFLAIFEVLASNKNRRRKWIDECQNALQRFQEQWPPTDEINKIKRNLLLAAGVYQSVADHSETPFESKVAESKSEPANQSEGEAQRQRGGAMNKSHNSSGFFSAAPSITPKYEIHPLSSYWLGHSDDDAEMSSAPLLTHQG